MVSDSHRAHPFGGSREKQIAHAQGIESADIGNHLVDGKYHIGRVSPLYLLPPDTQGEVLVLHSPGQLFHRDKISYDSRAVKTP